MEPTLDVCRHCGAALSLARVVQLKKTGEYEYLCESCAVSERSAKSS